MKIEFLETVTVYPFADKKPVFAKAGEVREDFPEAYAAMLLRKGHAREVADKVAAVPATPVPAVANAPAPPPPAAATTPAKK